MGRRKKEATKPEDTPHLEGGGNGRNTKGQFVKGEYKGGPGRPPRTTEVAYLDVLKTNCTLEKWLEITAKQVDLAVAGDEKAVAFLAKYVLPNPEQRMLIEQKSQVLTLHGFTRDEIALQMTRLLVERVKALKDETGGENGEK